MASRSDDSPKRSGENRLTAFLPADRLRAFADGVFAIVITLLVLELPVPEATDDLLWALLEAWPDFLAYVISFVFIGGFWITHSSITRLTEHEDGVTFRMTLVMLFFVSLLPFSTSLMAKHLVGPGSRLSVFIYGLDLLFASFMLDRIMRYLARRPELLVDGLAEEDLRIMEHRRLYGIMLDGVGVLLALILPRVAIAIYVLVAFYFILQPLFYGRTLKHSLEKQGE
ncbi:TMEM175 family protein [Methanoculleus frigidifontis]|uniref:TMEM175 family protein n=1 Tax=Methanoculleus frigidifontis TaxID=2584085 RepID=UPI002658AC8D|nr:TMEM175 family protein [Methanoculleus sp. FWC-SCC1]